MSTDLVGYDTSESARSPSVVCADCGDGRDGSPLYRADDWRGPLPSCSRCGERLDLTEVT